MSPEYLIKGDGLELAKSLIESNLLGFLAVDEAHCISVWGHDFRPEYLKIKEFRSLYPNIPILAVTATATNSVVNDISTNLTLNNPTVIRANFDRPNLFLECIPVKSIEPKILLPYFDKYKNDKIIIEFVGKKGVINKSICSNKIIYDYLFNKKNVLKILIMFLKYLQLLY
jgi:superfamily II DNA helicase RecQ